MKRIASLLFTLIAVCAFRGQSADNATVPLKLGDTWQVFLNVQPPKSYDSVPASLKTPDGKPVVAKTVKLVDDGVDLGKLSGAFQAGDIAILYNEFQADQAGVMKAGAAADWWMEVSVNGKPLLSTMGKGNGSSTYAPNDHPFDLPVVKGKNLLAATVRSGSSGWRFVCGAPRPVDQTPNVKFTADAEWKAVAMPNNGAFATVIRERVPEAPGKAVATPDNVYHGDPAGHVKAGSALDLSALAELPRDSDVLTTLGLGAPRRLPRLVIGPTGKLAAANRPDIPVKLRSTGINFSWVAGRCKPDWKTSFLDETLNAQRLGYNTIRLIPCVGKSFSPDAQDKADFLLHALGRRGMYCLLDCFFDKKVRSSWDPGDSRLDTTLRMYLGDEIVRGSWKRGTEELMNHVNPYNGLAWKDDPAIACAILFNEQEWAFFHPKSSLAAETRVEFDVKFRQWLERKYNEPRALAKAWGDTSIKGFAQIETPETFPTWNHDERGNDFVLFCGELSHENAAWMRETLRATGYRGLVAQYNISQWLEGQEARWEEAPVTIANAYHNHPTGFDRPGSKCGQNSSIGAGIWYWRGVASTRFADRPFIETEFNHSFWNPYQYECGAVFGAYSALQNFDALSIHGGAVFSAPPRPGLGTFEVANSPIARAGEFLSGCLFLRGDVKASPHRVELQIPKEYLKRDCDGARSVSGEQSKLAFITGFSVAFPWAKPAAGVGVPPPPDLTIEPDDGSAVKSAGGGWAVETVDAKSAKFSLDAAVAGMKAKGILPKDNLSDPKQGVFQSDTGEITMRTKENLLKVATPRSEAVTLEGGKGESVGQLEVVNTSVPSLVAACAVDQEPLAASNRVVLVYSTYAVNSGMELSADRTTLVNLGGLPVLMRTGKLNIKLKNANGAALSLYALGFDGSRREKLPLKFKDGVLEISLDTAALKDGPTPFFELSIGGVPAVAWASRP